MTESEYLQSWDDWTVLNNYNTKPKTRKTKRPTQITTKHRGVNVYPGVCVGCGLMVEAKAGLRVMLGPSWRVIHNQCCRTK